MSYISIFTCRPEHRESISGISHLLNIYAAFISKIFFSKIKYMYENLVLPFLSVVSFSNVK